MCLYDKDFLAKFDINHKIEETVFVLMPIAKLGAGKMPYAVCNMQYVICKLAGGNMLICKLANGKVGWLY